MYKSAIAIAFAALVLVGCAGEAGTMVRTPPIPPAAPLLQCEPITLAPQIAK